MKLFLTVLILVFSRGAMAERLNVVTTTTDLASIVQKVGGEWVSVQSICSGREDPHFLQARPGFILKARNADLWVCVGCELEVGWERPIIDGSRNHRISIGGHGYLDASRNTLLLDLPTEKVTRAMGDVHPSGNPHYWLDPWNGRIVAETVAAKLAELMPEKGADFEAHCHQFQREIDERMFGADVIAEAAPEVLWPLQASGRLDAYLEERGLAQKLSGWAAKMRSCRGIEIVTYHRSWIYFTNRFGIKIAGELEPKPGIPPTAGHLSEIIEQIKAQQVRLVLQENYYSVKAGKNVAARTGIPHVVVANSVGGDPAAVDYLTLIDQIVEKISHAVSSDEERGT